MNERWRLVVGLVGIVLDACSGPATGGNEVGQGSSAQVETDLTGPFCPVQALLESRCQSCHSDPPLSGVPMPLTSYDDLLAPGSSDASKRAVDVSIARMQDRAAPMPPLPAPPATAAEVAVLQDWVAAGMPAACAAAPVASANDYNTPLTCTSASYTRGGESPNMDPGGACISCHSSSREGPLYQLAGTVYPSAHEPNDCNGVDGSGGAVQVVVTDAMGAEIVLRVNAVGNFYSREAFAPPYQAKVVQGGRERVMSSSQQSGDCNACHTESGASQAPGRIMLP